MAGCSTGLSRLTRGQLAAEKRSLRKSIKEEMDRLATKTDGKGGVEVRMHAKQSSLKRMEKTHVQRTA